MKRELQKKLFQRFGFLNHPDPLEPIMRYGIQCSDGWFDLIWKLCEELEQKNFNGVVQQVKEKSGLLNFCVDKTNDIQQNVINKYEEKSSKICERCGKKGKLYKIDWLQTLCKECFND